MHEHPDGEDGYDSKVRRELYIEPATATELVDGIKDTNVPHEPKFGIV